MPTACRHSSIGQFEVSATTPMMIPHFAEIEVMRENPGIPALYAAECGRSFTPPPPGLLDAEFVQHVRFHQLLDNFNPSRDRPHLEIIVAGLGSASDEFAYNTAQLAKGIYQLDGWEGPDRYTLAKLQMYHSAQRHGLRLTIPYHCIPRDIFESETEHLAEYMTDHLAMGNPTSS